MKSFEQMFNQAGDIFFVLNKDLDILSCNQNFANLYNTVPDKLIGKNSKLIYPDFEKSVFYESLNETISNGYPSSRVGFSNNLNKWIAARAIKIEENQFFIYANTVIENKNGFVSFHDTLTSISNRFALEDDLDKSYLNKKTSTLYLIDILKFKAINDNFGMTQGDMILMEFAARLKKNLGKQIKNANVYRYNSDQFAVLIPYIIDKEINNTLTAIKMTKEQPFIAKSNQIVLDLAIGYTVIDSFNNSFQDVITNTEMALTKAKKSKNKSVIKYDEFDCTFNNKNKVVLANELKKALKEDNGLVLYYQCQVDCSDKKVCGAEALIRWNHPTQGFISPAQFLPVAEEFDLMFELDKFVIIRSAIEIYDLMQKQIELPISINLSSSSLCNPKIVDLIESVLKRVPVNPNLITVEITESAFIEEKKISQEIVEKIKGLGINIALDDFCTGYSSMEYLLSYPADYLKIDREFIKDIHQDTQRQHIVKGLITMAQSMDMSVVAEGVELVEEANILVQMNCNIIQGYFFGRPEKYEDLISLIKNQGYSKSKGKNKGNITNPKAI